MHATQVGMILGTAGYMAPEQAKGKPADKRADIWAFGVVLHELLTGQRLFLGETVTDTLAAVVLTRAETGGCSEPGAASAQALPGKRSAETAARYRRRDGAAGGGSALRLPLRRLLLLRRDRWSARLAWPVAFGRQSAGRGSARVHPLPRNSAGGRDRALHGCAAGERELHASPASPPSLPTAASLPFPPTGADGVPRIWIRSMDSLTAQPLPGSETVPVLVVVVLVSRQPLYRVPGRRKTQEDRHGWRSGAGAVRRARRKSWAESWNRDGVILFAQDGAPDACLGRREGRRLL